MFTCLPVYVDLNRQNTKNYWLTRTRLQPTELPAIAELGTIPEHAFALPASGDVFITSHMLRSKTRSGSFPYSRLSLIACLLPLHLTDGRDVADAMEMSSGDRK